VESMDWSHPLLQEPAMLSVSLIRNQSDVELAQSIPPVVRLVSNRDLPQFWVADGFSTMGFQRWLALSVDEPRGGRAPVPARWVGLGES
jgi:hypothetical protein